VPGSAIPLINFINFRSRLTRRQVLEQCVGLHSITLQRLKQTSDVQTYSWGCVIVGNIRIVKAGFDQSRLHKLIQSRQQGNSEQGLGQALLPLDNLYQACYELLSETFTLLAACLERSKSRDADSANVLEEICDEIVPLCEDNQLRQGNTNLNV